MSVPASSFAHVRPNIAFGRLLLSAVLARDQSLFWALSSEHEMRRDLHGYHALVALSTVCCLRNMDASVEKRMFRNTGFEVIVKRSFCSTASLLPVQLWS